MQNSNIYERRCEEEIDLMQLALRIIKRWKWLALGAIIGMVIGGCIGYVKTNQAKAAAQAEAESIQNTAEVEQSLEERVLALNEEEQNEIRDVQELLKYIDVTRKYMDESVYLNIDPFNENVVTLQYIVETENEVSNLNYDLVSARINSIVSAYTSFVDNSDFDAYEKLDWISNKAYVHELVSVNTVTTDGTMIRTESAAFNITIKADTKEHAEQVANVIKSEVSSHSANVASCVENHKLVLAEENAKTVVDTEISSNIYNYNNAIFGAENQINSTRGDFTEEQQLIYLDILNARAGVSYTSEGLSVTTIDNATETNLISQMLKYVGICVFLGLFVVCGVITILFAFDGKVHDGDNMSVRFNTRLFGIRDKKNEYAEEMIVTNIMTSIKKNKIEQVMVIALDKLETEDSLYVEKLIYQLRDKAGMDVEFEDNANSNPSILNRISEFGEVMLLVKPETSKVKEIEQLLIFCREQEANVLGIICL